MGEAERGEAAPRVWVSFWCSNAHETREWGAMVTTVLHPQCSGRPMRLRLLREFLQYAESCPDLWIATGAEIASHRWKATLVLHWLDSSDLTIEGLAQKDLQRLHSALLDRVRS